MTTKKIKKYLYYDDKANTYIINYGQKISTKNKKQILRIYKELKETNWLPSKCIQILKKYKTRKTHPTTIKTYKGHNNKINLYIKGFYIQSASIPEIKKTIKEYIQTNYNDKFIDEKRNQVIPTKKRGLPKHITYVPQSKKYKISKHKDGTTKYYGTFDTLEEAKKEVERQTKSNWETPRIRRRAKYNKSEENKYIQKQYYSDNYYIVKQGEYYGTYKRIEDAREERDWLVANNWSYENIDLY